MTQSSTALPPAELYLLDAHVLSALMRDPAGGVAQTYRAKLTQPGQFTVAISTVLQCELLCGVTKRARRSGFWIAANTSLGGAGNSLLV